MRISTVCRWAVALLCILVNSNYAFPQSSPPFSFTTDPRDTLGRQLEDEQRRLIDPALGRVPNERLAQERERMLSGQKKSGAGSTQSAVPGMTWQERGPSNAGGITRAALFDPNDPTHKKVWVGSPSGGLWYTNDITDPNATWTPVSDNWESTVVTCLAADPANPQVMYAGTGDTYQYTIGGGIWKTTNGGTTWSRLTSTIPGTFYGSLAASFGYIQRLVVNSSGHIFAATRYGVVHSVDAGNSWQFVLAPTQAIGIGGTPTNNYYVDLVSDLEVGTDGIVYAAFNPSRVFRANSTAGTAWTEITPAGVPTGGERTELALAPSTSGAGQVVYALTRGYNSVNYNQDIKWFRKTTDAGSTWSSATVPTHTWGGHFTDGLGYNALSLTVDPTNAMIVYAGGYDSFRSTDGGSTWSSRLTTAFSNFYGLFVQPGNSANALVITNRGVSWATGWGDAATSTSPQLINRNNGYRIGNVTAAAMKPAPGSNYVLGSIAEFGLAAISNAGLSLGSRQFESDNYSGRVFIDEDTPSLQLFSIYSSWYRITGNSSAYLFNLANTAGTNPVAYDSQSNTLYVAEYVNNGYTVRRAVGMGGTPTFNNFPLAGYPNSMRLSNDRNSLFVGYSNSLITKYTNCTQSAPISTTIASNAVLPGYLEISSIDVGATDSELLITASNYGVPSVWYTNNGGVTWINKDAAGTGLPDVPVRTGMFNPQNRQQVILGTDLGVWTTNDITATNPGWTLSSTGLGLMKVNQLSYRASDGRLIAATAGRGIFETDALAVPYTPSLVSITSISNTTLCAGSTVAVSFSASGPVATGISNYEVWLSDSTGNFASQRRVGTGSSSPISLTLPSGGLRYGTSYQFKVVAPDADVASPASATLVTIGNVYAVDIADQLTNIAGRAAVSYISTNATICPSDQIWLSAKATSVVGGRAPIDSYQWLLNNTPISGATSQTYLTGQPGVYQVQVRQAGCVVPSPGYTLTTSASQYAYIDSDYGILPQCDNSPAMLNVAYRGVSAAIQWFKNDVAIAGATSFTYSATQGGIYKATVTSSGCSVSIGPLALTLGRALSAKIGYAQQDSVLCAGTFTGYVGLYAESISSIPSSPNQFSVSWFKDGQPMNQVQGQTYIQATQPGNYTYELRQGTCVTRSNAAVVTQGPLPIPSTYLGDTRTACFGDSRTISSNGSYQTFQWQKDGVDIPNATGYSYTAQSTGNYAMRVSKGSCVATSLPMSLTFANNVTAQIVVEGYSERCSNIWLNASSYGRIGNAQFQWFKDNSPISGATSSFISTSQSGLYSVVITNGACAIVSKQVMIRPYTQRKPFIITNGTVNSCQNSAPRLQIDNYWGGTLQWKKDGLAVNGLTEFAFYPTQSGRYSVQATNSCGTIESDPVEVRIGEPTTAAITGNALVNSGQVAQLPVALSGPAPWSFTLNNGQSVQNTYLNPHPLSVTATGTSTYSVVAVDNACGTGTSSGQATVTVGSGQADLSVLAQVSSRTPKVNDIVSYSLLVTNAGPQNAGNLQVSSRLPAGVEFVDAQSAGVSAAGGVVSGNVPTLLINETTVLTYRLRVTQPGTYFTAAQITTTNTPDPDSQPNSGTGDGQDDAALVDLRTADAAGTLVASANPNQVPLPRTQGNQPPTSLSAVELSLAMQSSTQAPKAGDVISLSLTVANRGGIVANNIVVQTLLPAGWQLTNTTGFVVSGQTVKAYVNQLAVNGRTVLVLPVQVGAGSGQVRTQILEVAEPVSNAIPGNGYQNGERDEANVVVRVR